MIPKPERLRLWSARNDAINIGSKSYGSITTTTGAMKNDSASSPPLHPSLKGIRFVLFPHDPRVQWWDHLFLCVLVYYCFAVPYAVGVSGGYWIYTNRGWFGFNVVLNLVYVADTVMHFFRAYYDDDGRIVYELRSIARNYFFSRRFVLDFIASLPMQIVIYFLEREYYTDGVDTGTLHLLGITQLLRLLRIARIIGITKSSNAIRTSWEKQNVAQALLLSFLLKMVFVSHWIACFWSFLAFSSAWSFGPTLGERPNWISSWREGDYVEGGIDPIGWENDIDRYALSLFWSIQSLTSIGYGNIAPITRVEYYFANFLMLLCGIFWAFVIGNIVAVVQYMNAHHTNYRMHLDEANALIRCFVPTTNSSTLNEADIDNVDAVAKRVRRFVSAQYDRSNFDCPEEYFSSATLDQVYPTLGGLSEELRQTSSLHLVGKYIQMVPYLSRNFLTPKEQAHLAFKCIHMEFCRGEQLTKHPQYGRGILILKRGFCASHGAIGSAGANEPTWFKTYSIDDPIAVNDVLVEDSFLGSDQPRYCFVSYSLVVFIPQTAISEVMSENKMAWKKCARWKYLQACLLKWSRDRKYASR